MDKLEELLPGIEKYLRTTLAKESLSKLAEQQRLYYVERLDVIQLPPHRPPKLDVEKSQMQGRKLPEPGRNKSNDDFIAHQRAISRQTLSTGEPQAITCEDNPVPNNGLGIDSDQYEEGLYEEPVTMEDNLPSNQPSNHLPPAPAASFELDSDADSSTSYESYDEPDLDDTYNNVGFDGQVKSDIQLPRLKTKRKKKPQSIHERYYKQLEVITYEGELYHRGKLGWAKRYCAICDGILYCYKDRDSKPVLGISLLGYDVVLQEKEKGRANVLRLAKPGCETQFISTDSASETQAWLNKVEPLCYATSGDTPEDSKSTDRTGSISSMELYTEGPGSSMANGSPSGKNRKVTNTLSADGKRDKKKKFFSFGKRKGRTAAQQLQIVTGGTLLDRNTLASPDITISGVVKLSSLALLNDESWQYKNCAIRNGVFECYKDDSTSSDLDFSLPLTECELRSENSKDKDSLSLAVTKQGETAFIMEPEDKLDQGYWLSALLKHVGNEGLPGPECQELEDITYTYVDSRSLASLPSDTVEVNSLHLSLNEHSADERQYADLSDNQSEGSGVGQCDTYDEPPVETGDRQSKMYLQGNTGSLIRLFAGGSYNNVYEEVAETISPTSSVPDSQRSSSGSAQADQAAQEPATQPTTAESTCRTGGVGLADWLSGKDGDAERHTYAVSRGASAADVGNLRRFSNSSDNEPGMETEALASNLTHAVSLEELLGNDLPVYYGCTTDVASRPPVSPSPTDMDSIAGPTSTLSPSEPTRVLTSSDNALGENVGSDNFTPTTGSASPSSEVIPSTIFLSTSQAVSEGQISPYLTTSSPIASERTTLVSSSIGVVHHASPVPLTHSHAIHVARGADLKGRKPFVHGAVESIDIQEAHDMDTKVVSIDSIVKTPYVPPRPLETFEVSRAVDDVYELVTPQNSMEDEELKSPTSTSTSNVIDRAMEAIVREPPKRLQSEGNIVGAIKRYGVVDLNVDHDYEELIPDLHLPSDLPTATIEPTSDAPKSVVVAESCDISNQKVAQSSCGEDVQPLAVSQGNFENTNEGSAIENTLQEAKPGDGGKESKVVVSEFVKSRVATFHLIQTSKAVPVIASKRKSGSTLNERSSPKVPMDTGKRNTFKSIAKSCAAPVIKLERSKPAEPIGPMGVTAVTPLAQKVNRADEQENSSIPPTTVEETNKETDRQTRVDLKTNADIIDSPSLSNETNRASFSRESSCSSEGSSRKLSETIAKSRAKFENTSHPDGSIGKWSGYKLAGANNSSTVKRTPSIGSTTSTKSTPNSAASSPKNPRASLFGSGTVDRFKSAFEAREANNNTIIDKTVAPTKSQVDSLWPPNKKASGNISPIRSSAERGISEPPKFVSVFNPPTNAANSKPKKLEIKSVTPAPDVSESKVVETDKLDFESSLRFDIDITSKDGPVTFAAADCFSARKSSTLPASSPVRVAAIHRNSSLSAGPGPAASRASAKTFLTSALQRFADDSTERSKASAVDVETPFVPTFSNEEDEQTRLDTLRQKLTNLRKERTKVRDQKRSTVLQADIDRLAAAYKKVDEEYKMTHKQIEILEDRKLQRIKDMKRDSIERRRLESERYSVSGKKKIWESSS